ncbi:MAG TPA: TPM domain-containing protein, partial [Chthoniobacterales bacterium]|nr:TPM domain-containing protein [Chthoniobacterales bacterium]
MKRAASCLVLIASLRASVAFAAEVIPPAPTHYFNDYVGIVSQSAADQFDRQLRKFDVDTSNQVVVAVFSKMQSDDDVPAYTQRVFDAWGVGQ